jgi:hypothetical protein
MINFLELHYRILLLNVYLLNKNFIIVSFKLQKFHVNKHKIELLLICKSLLIQQFRNIK